MCNDYGNRIACSDYVEAFSQIRLPLRLPIAPPNLEPRDDIWPTEIAPIFRRRADGVELARLRWGFAPSRPKAPPAINFRSDGRRVPNGRCLIPASHFFEFTGAKAPKLKWRFTKVGEPWFCKFRFKVSDRVAERRLRNTETVGSPCEMNLFSYSNKMTKVTRFHATISPSHHLTIKGWLPAC